MGAAMRRLLAPAALLATLASAAAPSLAHEDHTPHVNPLTADLGPGEDRTWFLEFTEDETSGGKFGAGWVFVVSARHLEGPAARIELLTAGDNRTVGSWTVEPGNATQVFSGFMPSEDFYSLRVTNPAEEGRLRMIFFYDQSCNCAAKPIPFEVPDGLVVFNIDVVQGRRVKAEILEPPAMSIDLWLATRTDEASVWPEDFRVLQESREARAFREEGAPSEGRVHTFEFTADATQRYYFFAQSDEVFRDRIDPQSPGASLLIVPQYEVTEGEPKATPLGGLLPLAALALAGLLAAALRARPPKTP